MIFRVLLKFSLLGLLLWGFAWVYTGIPREADPLGRPKPALPTLEDARDHIEVWRERIIGLRRLFQETPPAVLEAARPALEMPLRNSPSGSDQSEAGQIEPGSAVFYRWRDSAGRLHFSDSEPEGVDGVERIELP